MTEFVGDLKINQGNREITIPYKIVHLWGKLHLYIADKSGPLYSFYYTPDEQIRKCDIRECPKSPTDVSQKFFNACTKEARKHRSIRQVLAPPADWYRLHGRK